ncbi:hypothetical protein LIER_13839 [Lithospermum erythrorhizon]|uniref:Uncharacterized protein n=1 Tax=Lithospermum erythrorhizon TaxID=34254 RepID=A0AAV3Q1H1_LITER
MLLTAFYDEIDSAGYQHAHTSNKGKAISETQSPLSQLKRQMSQITIAPEPSAKKKLLLMDDALEADDESSNSAT